MQVLKTHKTFEGKTQFWEHESVSTKTKMKFSTFIPAGPVRGCLIWLSGLTCTDENFITKAGAQKVLAEKGLMVICPDTSPRGLQLPQEHDSWDFGSGASFYLDATTPGYRDHYRMETYIADELHSLIQKEFNVPANKISIFGHSMGGHGALTLGLRHPQKFVSVSAFSPIVNPVNAPWGVKAFTGYLGENKTVWAEHDATELVRSGKRHPQALLVDQGGDDEFLTKGQLLTDNLTKACKEASQKLEVNMREGYDHSYYFISSFVENHIEFHSRLL
ncbi:S-formylglutathione hydrolase [Bdellovibrio bacteriovorus]|uniref:S-formylglutathione hydrolase n=1 Tax=Bdellovibrio bacteriovorus TaxID=959 RepID=A0A150WEK8_BDEBC|nr:S-formylglutathione hydrolase [Bdellovibrio bacteriovorus]KYG61558.1 S-formylglutathione hydrolase [Bdellovibrio bacteriovorus]